MGIILREGSFFIDFEIYGLNKYNYLDFLFSKQPNYHLSLSHISKIMRNFLK